MTKIKDYKGLEIRLDFDGKFEAYDQRKGEVVAYGDSMAEVLKNTDLILKHDFKAKGVKVWIEDNEYGSHRLIQGKITSSRVEQSSYSTGTHLEFRVTWGKKWSDESLDSMYKDTPENVESIAKYNANYDKIKELEKENEEILAGLQKYESIEQINGA